jgi:hypothetical protein
MGGNGAENYKVVNPQGTVFDVRWTDRELAEARRNGFRMAGSVETGKKRVNRLYHKHLGEPVIICGCGHSLTKSLAKQVNSRNLLTIGVNECFRLLPAEDFFPKYHLHSDYATDFGTYNVDTLIEMEKAGSKIIVPDKSNPIVLKQLDCYIFGLDLGHKLISSDEEDYVWFSKGYTAVYTAIQLAIYMGCNPIFLIGVDFKLKDGYMHSYDTKRMSKKQAEKWEKKAFPAKMHVFNGDIPKFAKENNAMIFNCSKNSRLDGFPYADIKEVMQWML